MPEEYIVISISVYLNAFEMYRAFRFQVDSVEELDCFGELCWLC